MADKVITEEEFIDELESGMTIGVGGWGSRRKPMSLVRSIIRSGVTDLTVVTVSYTHLTLPTKRIV